MSRTSEGGFALLEALVALVIVAGVGTALFALINTGLQSLIKAEAHVQATTLQPQILAWVRSVDLSELPQELQVRSEFISQQQVISAEAHFQRFQGPTFALTGSGAMGLHQVALYDVSVRLNNGQRTLDEIHTRIAASKQVLDAPTL